MDARVRIAGAPLLWCALGAGSAALVFMLYSYAWGVQLTPVPAVVSGTSAALKQPNRPPADPTWLLDRIAMPLKGIDSRPAIFVYNLPPRFNLDIIAELGGLPDPLSAKPPHFRYMEKILEVELELLVFLQMVYQNPLRTLDPRKASLFFVPVFPCAKCFVAMGGRSLSVDRKTYAKMRGCNESHSLMLEAMEWVMTNGARCQEGPAGECHQSDAPLQAWHERQGKDHIFMTFMDYGPCMVNWVYGVPLPLRKSIFLTPFGDHRNSPGAKQKTSQCYKHDLNFVVSAMWIYQNDELHEFVAPGSKKTIFAYFRGMPPSPSTHQRKDGLNEAVRRKLLMNLHYNGSACPTPGWLDGPQCEVNGQDVIISDVLVSPAQYIHEIASSLYCLCPPGWALWSFRFFECIAAGSIPVLFDDGRTVLPYEDIVPYEKFVVRVAPKTAGKALLDTLAAIPKEKAFMMRVVMFQYRRYLIYSAAGANLRHFRDSHIEDEGATPMLTQANARIYKNARSVDVYAMHPIYYELAKRGEQIPRTERSPL